MYFFGSYLKLNGKIDQINRTLEGLKWSKYSKFNKKLKLKSKQKKRHKKLNRFKSNSKILIVKRVEIGSINLTRGLVRFSVFGSNPN